MRHGQEIGNHPGGTGRSQISRALRPVFRVLGPVFHALRPVFRALRPVFRVLGPVFRALRPVFRVLGPVFHALRPIFRVLGPIFRVLGPVSRPSPLCDRPQLVAQSGRPRCLGGIASTLNGAFPRFARTTLRARWPEAVGAR